MRLVDLYGGFRVELPLLLYHDTKYVARKLFLVLYTTRLSISNDRFAQYRILERHQRGRSELPDPNLVAAGMAIGTR